MIRHRNSPETNPIIDTQPEVALTPEDVLDDLLNREELNDGGKIQIYRKGPDELKYCYIGVVPVREFDKDNIKNRYGGGEYRLVVSLKNKHHSSTCISIDPRYKGTLGVEPAIVQPIIAPSNGGNSGPDMSIIMGMMRSQSESQFQMLQLMLSTAGESTKALTAIMVAALGSRGQESGTDVMKALMPAMVATINKPAPAPPSMIELVQVFQSLKSLLDPGEKGGDSTLDRILAVAGPLVGPVIGKLMEAGRPRQVMVETKENVIPQRPIIEEPENVQKTVIMKDNEILSLFNNVIPVLCRGCDNNVSVASYLDVTRNLLNDQQFAQLQELLKKDNWMEVLFQNNPEVIKRHEWFDSLRDVLLDPSLADEPEETSELDSSVTLDKSIESVNVIKTGQFHDNTTNEDKAVLRPVVASPIAS